jgi:hypothetical protein
MSLVVSGKEKGMKSKVHHPVPRKEDATGLTLVGRHDDGRYQYEVLTCAYNTRVASLTHARRVGLAIIRAALMEAYGVSYYEVYPLLKDSSTYRGFGSLQMNRMWLKGDILGQIGVSYLQGKTTKESWNDDAWYWETVAHEAGHNHQPLRSKTHGPEFNKAHAMASVLLWKVLHKGWPKLDMRKLRDSVAPHLRGKKKAVNA